MTHIANLSDLMPEGGAQSHAFKPDKFGLCTDCGLSDAAVTHSGTPRTDKEESHGFDEWGGDQALVSADFARRLEFELAQANRDKAEWQLLAETYSAGLKMIREQLGLAKGELIEEAIRKLMRADQKGGAMNKPNYEQFGQDVWNWIKKQGGDYCGNEDSEDILPMAQRARLVRRVIYDPAKHGEIGDCEPGDEIWFWDEELEAQP